MQNNDLFDLVRELQASESPAKRETLYNQLFNALWNKAYYYCFKYLNNSYDAEDAAQEAFLILSKRIYELRAPEAFNRVFNMILSEVCIKNSKRNKKHGNVVELSYLENAQPGELANGEDMVLEDIVLGKDLRDQIVKIVDTLPEKQREAVMLYYFGELNQEEIAKATSSNIGAVNRRLVVARKSIRESFGTLVKNGGLDFSFAVLPMLTQILQRDARMFPAPDMAKSWTAVSQKLKSGAFSSGSVQAGKVAAGTAKTQIFLNTALTVLVTATVVVGGVFGVQIYEHVTSKSKAAPADVSSEIAPSVGEDIVTALKKVVTKADLDRFVATYHFDESATESYERVMFTLFSKVVDDMRINVGLRENDDNGFKITYEITGSSSKAPEDIRAWFNVN